MAVPDHVRWPESSSVKPHNSPNSDRAGMVFTRADQAADRQKEAAWKADADIRNLPKHAAKASTWLSGLTLAYYSLGVIYGDIGTSPLYTISSIFAAFTPERDDVLQAISLIFWTLTLVGLIKYVLIVLHANDHGEGGTFALYSHLCRNLGVSPFGTLRTEEHQQLLGIASRPLNSMGRSSTMHRASSSMRHRLASSSRQANTSVITAGASNRTETVFEEDTGRWWNFKAVPVAPLRRWLRESVYTQRTLLIVSMLATSMVFGDGVLTPAVSVVSAVSGLSVASTEVTPDIIVGVSCAILVLLFAFQYKGTHTVAWIFSPIVVLWLLANAAIGIYNMSTFGTDILHGLSPYYIYQWFNQHGTEGWVLMGSVMLCVTGSEAMFADLGHFSIGSIGMSFGFFAYPCLVLTYLGQGAYLITNPGDVGTAYWSSVPVPIFWPMLVLATLASVVASQALISASFSITRQAMVLGVFPKLKVVHTSEDIEGQIYVGPINWSLMVLTIAVVAGFKGDSVKLGNAYGLTISAVMFITTFLVSFVMILDWELSPPLVLLFFCVFGLIDGVFLSANCTKIPKGGWFAILVTVGVASIMIVWWSGQLRRRATMAQHERLLPAETFTVVASSSLSTQAVGRGKTAGIAAPMAEGYKFERDSGSTSDSSDSMAGCMPRIRCPGPLGEATEGASHSVFNPEEYGGLLHRFELPLLRGEMCVALTTSPTKPLLTLPGIGLFYTPDPTGIPPVLAHFLRNIEALHQVNVFVMVRYLPLPHIDDEDRLLVRCVPNLPYCYQVVARYGYHDHVDHGRDFVNDILTALIHMIEDRVGLDHDDQMICALEDDLTQQPGFFQLGHAGEGTMVRSSRTALSGPAGEGAIARASKTSQAGPVAEGTTGSEEDGRALGSGGGNLISSSTVGTPFEFATTAAAHAAVGHTLPSLLEIVLDGPAANGSCPMPAIHGSSKHAFNSPVHGATRMSVEFPSHDPRGPTAQRSLRSNSLQVRFTEPRMSVDLRRVEMRLGESSLAHRVLRELSGSAAHQTAGFAKLSDIGAAVQEGSKVDEHLEDAALRVAAMLRAAKAGVVYYFGRSNIRMRPDSSLWENIVYDMLYRPMMVCASADNEAWNVPFNNLVELGMVVYI